MTEKSKNIIAQMTLEEKAGMCSGHDFWHLKSIERLGIPQVMVTDGPHGLRKQAESADHLGINNSIEAICFPTAVGTAAAFDRDMMTEVGKVLGDECQAENVSVLLGPAVNIKRSPLCGRNFEYISEDPYLTGELAGSYISGLQSKNIGVSMKHYAVNSQESRRMTSSSNLDERTLREIYLTGFELAVKQGKPWTIMSSYNRVNGEFASESQKLLTDILRDEWGFDGYVVTDWSGTNDRVKGLKAGNDLEMPSSGGVNDKKIVDAVNNGELDVAVLDVAVGRILDIIFRYADNRDESATFDRAEHHKIAKAAALQTMVLLKNEKNILPLNPASKIAFIGEFAANPRFQGSGSSFINAHKVVSAVEAVKGVADVVYAQGYVAESVEADKDMQAQAVAAAQKADVAVIFAGLPNSFESEGFDRTHMDIPQNQLTLIEEIGKVQKNIVVVLHNGSPITMPWLDKADGVLESYLAGETVGEAQVDLLFGKANPCAKLAESFPLTLEDNPSYLNFPGEKDETNFAEGVFVGYRYYDSKKMDVLFPFGHGLSYTNYEYSNFVVSKTALKGKDDTLSVKVDVTNTGKMAGKEIVQVYIGQKNSAIIRPKHELKQFAKVALAPGETKTVTMELNYRSFAYYDVEQNDWWVLAGEYEVQVGKSSRDLCLSANVTWDSPAKKGFRVSNNSTIGDLQEHPATKPIIDGLMQEFAKNSAFGAMAAGSKEEADKEPDLLGGAGAEMMAAMMRDMPIRSIRIFGGEQMDAVFDGLIMQMNGAVEAAEAGAAK